MWDGVWHLGRKKSGSMRTYEWKSVLMCEPEIGQVEKMRWEVIWSGLGAVGI